MAGRVDFLRPSVAGTRRAVPGPQLHRAGRRLQQCDLSSGCERTQGHPLLPPAWRGQPRQEHGRRKLGRRAAARRMEGVQVSAQ
eukprot:2784646-Pyramimonas_sp.AAC.1